MGENVPVRCPACRRTHGYAPPVYPCPCGVPVVPPLLKGAPAEPITHRTWTDDWVTVRCDACGRHDQWPQPELGCPCGTVLRVPVRPVTAAPKRPSAPTAPGAPGPGTPGPGAPGTPDSGTPGAAGPGAADSPPGGTDSQPGGPESPPGATASTTGVSTVPAHIPLPRTAAVPRPAFRPVTIRTARDAVTTAALYLHWLGFQDVVQPEDVPGTAPAAGGGFGVDLRGPGLVAQVDPTTRPTSLRAVECLWLTGLAASATSVSFSLAGYEEKARARADRLRLPLFVLDLTGTPQPLNGPADELIARGA
ncbi:hypothetical protein [Streptomyces ficellus]|uniref:Restriction endonuclease type IV Mrr domain-containing protein n=1 Tax=Streptomyces ficellus TaxID=1977088 RepID=A0A6I6F2D1_9ACTN|nr:hypothetical protein [Streptomyces ficellus]QGV77840.1 hypothetical protein EIZ62_05950 [Streptomyces ficellus]